MHLDDKEQLLDDYDDINNTVQDIVNTYKNHYFVRSILKKKFVDYLIFSNI